MKIKLYIVPLMIINCFIQAMDEPLPAKPQKALTRAGQPIPRQPEPEIKEKILEPKPNDVPVKVPAAIRQSITKPVSSDDAALAQRLNNLRNNLDSYAKGIVKTAVSQNLAILTKKHNYADNAKPQTIAFGLELIDYLQQKKEDSSLIIKENIKKLVPLLEQVNNTPNFEDLQWKIWSTAQSLILFSPTLNKIDHEEKKEAMRKYVDNSIEKAQEEKIAKENSLFARLKRLPRRIYTNISDWFSPISNMQFSLLFRVILIPMAYFLNEKQ